MKQKYKKINKINKYLKLIIYMFFKGFYCNNFFGSYIGFKKIFSNKTIKIMGLTIVRNEELIINDTMNHMEKFLDGIIVYDDDSEDNTLKEVVKNKKVVEILINKFWKEDREMAETLNRQRLLENAQKYRPSYFFCFDADERFEGSIKEFLLKEIDNDNFDSIKIRLFDAYITEEDKKSIEKGNKVYNFRKYFGPEYRDILMIWKNNRNIRFQGKIAREPSGFEKPINKFRCQHYGKSLSIEQWEETCKFYSENFPEPYKTKWEERKGKAIHTRSDFGKGLYLWKDLTDDVIVKLN